MSQTFTSNAYPLPVDFSAVERAWKSEGFTFGVFRDPPGQEWNGFVHQTDEYVLVAEGELKISVGDEETNAVAGDLVRIPKHVSHSLKTLSHGGSVWLYGYGNWESGND
jgi:cupin 2 domain-containing protein